MLKVLIRGTNLYMAVRYDCSEFCLVVWEARSAANCNWLICSRCPIYTAISYTWGSSVANCSIQLDGQHCSIGKNLWRFLEQYRDSKQNTSHLLWIDALSIDQNNNNDRTQQVDLMSRIYATADRVVAWLGPSYGDSETAMHHLAKPISHWRVKGNLSRLWTEASGGCY